MSTAVRVKGVKRYRHPKTRRWYAYHRATGKRIKAEFGSAAFFVELAALDASVPPTPTALPGSLGKVIEAYIASPHWRALRPKTRLSYERAIAVLRPLQHMPVIHCDRAFIIRLRDEKLFPKHGVWMANYVVTMLSILLAFAHDRGWIDANPLRERVRKIRSARAEGANRPWTELECRVVLSRAPAHLKLPIALAMFAGLRKTDFLHITRAAVRGDSITVRTSKRGVAVAIPVHPLLMAAFSERPRSDALQIAVTSRGEAWTESGFNSSFAKFKKALEREGAISPGLTPHGLRHTLGTKLREAGADDRTIADVLGQRSTSMARHYSENAALPDAAKALVSSVSPTGETKK